MPKKKTAVAPIDRLRGEIWVKRCMYVARVKTLMDLWRATREIVPDRSSWSQYKSGTVKPTKSTITLVNRQLPDTAKVFIKGPFDIPFWEVLDANPGVCDLYLREHLATRLIPDGSILQGKNLKTVTRKDCLLGLLQQYLPRNVWAKYKILDLMPVVDELYECRRKLLSEPAGQTHDHNSKSSNPLVEEMAISYLKRGMFPPWEEDFETIEGVDNVLENPRMAENCIPVTGISVDDFLAAFNPNPDHDDELEVGYETARVKSLKNVPRLIMLMAHDLEWSRLPPNKRFLCYELGDILALPKNPLMAYYESYVVNKKAPPNHQKLKRFNGALDSTPNLFQFQTLLAFIAAINLCRRSSLPLERSLAAFLWDGVQLAIRSQFNEDVYDIVKP